MYELNCEYSFAGQAHWMHRVLPRNSLKRWIREMRNDYDAKHIRVRKPEGALAYAQRHGLDPRTCRVVVGERLSDGARVTLSLRPGAVRWATERDYDHDAGIFPGPQSADEAIAKARVLYGAIDQVQNIRMEPLV